MILGSLELVQFGCIYFFVCMNMYKLENKNKSPNTGLTLKTSPTSKPIKNPLTLAYYSIVCA